MLFHATSDHYGYIHDNEKRAVRIASGAALGASFLPAAHGALLRSPTFSRIRLLFPFLWLGRRAGAAAALGASAAAIGEAHAKLAFEDTVNAEYRLIEPRLWTARALAPCVYLLLHPLLTFAALDGEFKGASAAAAMADGHPVQTIPFFAVLSATPARETTLSELVWGRVWAGFYPVERNPENARWRIV